MTTSDAVIVNEGRPRGILTAGAIALALVGIPLSYVIVALTGLVDWSALWSAALSLNCNSWAFFLLIVLMVKRVERRPLSSIGVKPPTWSTLVGVIELLVYGLLIIPRLSFWLVHALGLSRDAAVAEDYASFPWWLSIYVSVSAAITEETLYRGYAVERLIEVTGRRWLAALIVIMTFGGAHVLTYGVGLYAVGATLLGIAFTLVYIERRDLTTNIVGHSAINLASFFLN